MSYHPALGDIRQQLPRVAVVAALLAAAVTLISLDTRRAALPSERWYRLSRQQVMEADLAWQLGEAIDRVAAEVPVVADDTGRQMRERAVAIWEQRTLAGRANPAAAWRLGVVYGHRGYDEHAADMFTLAASLDEPDSNWYHALAEVYSKPDISPAELRAKAQIIAERTGPLVDVALGDCYRRLDDGAALAALEARRQSRAVRFLGGIVALSLLALVLVVTGVVTILVLILRRGMAVPRAVARPPFMVPWTLLDVAEAIAVLLFAMVLGGLITPAAAGRALADNGSSMLRALLLALQYVVVAGGTIGVIYLRVRQRSSHPLRTLGLRARRAWRLIGVGIAGYSVFLTVMVAVAIIIGAIFGGGIRLAQTAEEIVGSAQSPGEIAVYFVLVCVLAPIAEEVIFRGYVYGGLRRFLPARHAIILGAALFAGVHLNSDAFLVIALIGALLCLLYERTRSLLPGMIAHGLHNCLVLAVMLLQSM